MVANTITSSGPKVPTNRSKEGQRTDHSRAVARLFRDQEVAASNPVSPTRLLLAKGKASRAEAQAAYHKLVSGETPPKADTLAVATQATRPRGRAMLESVNT
jgi:hypothetical protein